MTPFFSFQPRHQGPSPRATALAGALLAYLDCDDDRQIYLSRVGGVFVTCKIGRLLKLLSEADMAPLFARPAPEVWRALHQKLDELWPLPGSAQRLFNEYAEFIRKRGEVNAVGLAGNAAEKLAVDQPLDVVEEPESLVTGIAVDLRNEGSEQELHLDDQRIGLRISLHAHLPNPPPVQSPETSNLPGANGGRKVGWHYWDGGRWAASAVVTETASSASA